MNRRSFLWFLGLVPAAAVLPTAIPAETPREFGRVKLAPLNFRRVVLDELHEFRGDEKWIILTLREPMFEEIECIAGERIRVDGGEDVATYVDRQLKGYIRARRA